MPVDSLAALDAIPVEQVRAAITRLSGRLLAAPASAPTDELLTPAQVAQLLQTPVRYVYRHAKVLGAIRVSDREQLRPQMRRLVSRRGPDAGGRGPPG